jgi:photosystem II stability/assembly factor-like uncharacterized protein
VKNFMKTKISKVIVGILFLIICFNAIAFIVKYNSSRVKVNDVETDSELDNNSVSSTPTTVPDNKDKDAISSVSPTGIVSSDSDKGDYQIYSLDFTDENNGWAIRYEYNKISDMNNSMVIRTRDGGAGWTEYEVDDAVLEKLVFADDKNGWAIATIGNGPESSGDSITYEILCSRDGGESWQVQLHQKAIFSGDFDIGAYDKMNAYAVFEGMMFITEDGGSTWTKTVFPVKNFYPQHMTFCNADTGWVVGNVTKLPDKKDDTALSEEYTLYALQTTDGGKSWKTQFSETYFEGPIKAIAIDFLDDRTGWFLTCDYATQDGDLYQTLDGGDNWEKINHMRCNRPAPTELEFITPLIGWMPLNVGAGGLDGGLMYTGDGGKSFDCISEGSYVEDESSIIYDMDSVEFISQTEGFAAVIEFSSGDYIAHTTDGGINWDKVYPKGQE